MLECCTSSIRKEETMMDYLNKHNQNQKLKSQINEIHHQHQIQQYNVQTVAHQLGKQRQTDEYIYRYAKI